MNKAKIIVGDHIGQCFQGQATFPNMECMARLNEKTKKIGKNPNNNWDGVHF